jgi:signal peptidase I
MKNSQNEAGILPTAASRKGLTRGFLYSGPSMQPTFRTGQMLYVRPDVKNVKPGDVVVYEQADRYIVHRVISVGEDGFITRGDNNQFADAGLVTPAQVIGRVEINEHRGGITPVQGGWLGLWLTDVGRAIRPFEPWLLLVFGWPYRLVKESRIVGRIWKPAISQIHLKNEAGALVKYLYRMKTVAIWNVSQKRFECRKPFDLVIFHPKDPK